MLRLNLLYSLHIMTSGSSAIQETDSGKGPLQYSLSKLVWLHLAPGVAILALYLVLVPPVRSHGWPPLFALILAAFFGVVPLQLGHLLLVGHKLNHRLSLAGVLGNNRTIPKWQYFAFVPLLFFIAVVILLATTPLDGWLTRTVFAWLPSWYFYSNPAVFASYPRKILAITFGLRIMIDGLMLPFVEELYFRAYLLPRLDRFGRWAPMINHGLFTLYHFWQPQNYPTILFGIFPMVWLTWWKRNYRLAILTHMSLNLISGILSYSLIVGKHPM
jgi:membrane protease YdiL (CAAX protease family)